MTHPLRTLTRLDLDNVLMAARKSPRKRATLRLHEHHETVQRMLNGVLPGTYVAPHKHENPDKVELFSILRGSVAIAQFDEQGNIADVAMLNTTNDVYVVDIAPRTYHTLIALEPSVLLEIIEGPYEAATHKQLAPWALEEDHPSAAAYLLYLTSIVHNWE